MNRGSTLPGSDRWGHPSWLVTVLGATSLVVVGGLAVVVAAPLSIAAGWPAWAYGALAFLLGVGLSGVVSFVWFYLPLRQAAKVAVRLGAGDLSRTVPEAGPRQLRVLVRVLNTLLADFQEVLLLFAYHLRSAHASSNLLRNRVQTDACDNVIRGLVAGIQGDLSQMQEMVQGFKYFRVRVESDAITDEGVLPREAPGGQSTASPSPSPDDKNSGAAMSTKEESRHE